MMIGEEERGRRMGCAQGSARFYEVMSVLRDPLLDSPFSLKRRRRVYHMSLVLSNDEFTFTWPARGLVYVVS